MKNTKHPRLVKFIKDYFGLRTYKEAASLLDDEYFLESEDYETILTYIYLFDN